MPAEARLERGCIYAARGAAYVQEALRSAASVARHMPGLPITLWADPLPAPAPHLDLRPLPPAAAHESDKINALLQSPYANSIYLDSDTYVCADLSSLFEILGQFDLAATRVNYYDFSPRQWLTQTDFRRIPPEFQQINSGMLAWRNSPAMQDLLADWQRRYRIHSEMGLTKDQPSLLEAVYWGAARLATLAPEYNLRILQGRRFLYLPVRVVHAHHPDLPRLAQQINRHTGSRFYYWRFGRLVVKPKKTNVWQRARGWLRRRVG